MGYYNDYLYLGSILRGPQRLLKSNNGIWFLQLSDGIISNQTGEDTMLSSMTKLVLASPLFYLLYKVVETAYTLLP